MKAVTTQVACFLSSGEELLLKEDYTQALDLFENALAMAQQNQDLQAEALALQRLGTVHFMQNQPELAIAAVSQALDIASDQLNPYILYDCHRQLVQIHKALRDFEQSLHHFEIAESIRADILNNQPHPAIQHGYPEITASAIAPGAGHPLGLTKLPGIESIQSPSTMMVLFRTIVEHANVGVGIFQDGYIVYANQRFQRWLGYSQEELRQLKMTDLMTPSAYWSVLQCHWKRIFEKTGGCHCEKKLLCKDGHHIDVEFNAAVIDYHHRPAILAFVRDITQRKQVELKLHQSEKQFRTLFNHMPIGLYRFASHGVPIEVNPAMAHMLGFANREAFLQDYALNAEQNSQQWRDHLLQAEQARGCELKLTRQDGRDIWVRMCAKAVSDPDDHQIFYEGSMEDISEIKAAYLALEELAVRDPLTHLYNRRHFFELASREMARAGRFKRPISLVMLDIDFFKAINDRYGHWLGDQVLQTAALGLQSNLRQSDILARYGGEEFVVLMPKTAQSQAWKGAERLRLILAASRATGEAGRIAMSASFGVTSWVPSKEGTFPDIDVLIRQADSALYRAKQAGRNQTVAHSDFPASWPDNHAWPTSDAVDASAPVAQAGEPAPG
jgi:diguanylate cyclase (GGDEF)-like protein/PAS domain S-box-containing protein